MDMNLEAMIAILALIAALPSSFLILWNCIQQHRRAGRRSATANELLPVARRPTLQWQNVPYDSHYNCGQLAVRRLLSASIEIVVDDGAPFPTLRTVSTNDSGFGLSPVMYGTGR
ncbi:hypothetical protein B0T14DRAFT_530039 [Immersiella caudata]|uniref:Uncharacterized protein n=1 Tax=Immersiella caudata TaxID=314043 RepID=A0AA39TL16_9PEZI|nr:hypothetical protein B0T14DRAFT_530039 [Immersiella caudata]